MPRMSVIISTCRLEEESNLPVWKRVVKGEEVGGRSLVRGRFQWLLEECVTPDMESFLEPTLRSLELQSFRDFEVIIVDWHAEKRRHITERYQGKLRIKHVRDKPSPWHSLKPPPGWEARAEPAFPAVCNARNSGVVLAEGELLLFMDDNIILEPETLEACWEWFERGYGVKLIRHRWNYSGRLRLEPDRCLWEAGWQPYSYRGAWSHGFTVSLEDMLKVNGFEEVLCDGTVGAEDIDLSNRLHNLLEKPSGKPRMVLDKRAVAWELGHIHVQEWRPCVRLNILLLDIVRDWERDILANTRKPTGEELEEYKRRMLERGEKLHPYWNLFPVEPFSLRELRDRYWRGEYSW
ncbi:MAG: hypothetical protein JRD89_15265 [Deltaproteobacteria bacterium]|nr:hypothetical protein [Deltaproteobacteria bacterium]